MKGDKIENVAVEQLLELSYLFKCCREVQEYRHFRTVKHLKEKQLITVVSFLVKQDMHPSLATSVSFWYPGNLESVSHLFCWVGMFNGAIRPAGV